MTYSEGIIIDIISTNNNDGGGDSLTDQWPLHMTEGSGDIATQVVVLCNTGKKVYIITTSVHNMFKCFFYIMYLKQGQAIMNESIINLCLGR